MKSELPGPVTRLYGREREIASLVYRRSLATAAQVEQALAHEVSNPAVRSMLNRLVHKGVLNRVQMKSNGAFIYAPAISDQSERERNITEVVDDFFDGSLPLLCEAVASLCAGSRRRRLPHQFG